MDPTKSVTTSILIIDADDLFRESLTALLNNLPDFTVIGETGLLRIALESAEELKPDVILMNVHFSDGRGIDAIRPLLAILPQTKIILLSMDDSDDLFLAALCNGASGFLKRNIHSNALIASIRAVVNGEVAISRSHINIVLDAFVRQTTNDDSDEMNSINLTAREYEVIHELELGSSNREIANHLTITENTVKRHIHSILKKLRLRSRREVAIYARKQKFR
jgi:two-component system nitrate/nitrite response regulator NarL